jgi:glucans biosynthesis protein
MTMTDPMTGRISRRNLLAVAGALVPASLVALPHGVFAQETTTAPAPALAAAQQFSFDLLTEEMRVLSTQPHVTAPAPEGFLGDLDYDDYRLIRFNDKRARWADEKTRFRLAAFHMGWLFPEPVRLYEVSGGMASEMLFSTDDFEYLNELAQRVPEHAELPGVAGFRLNHPINRPDKWDELVAFVGASYFRALGRNSAYGISARGLALNTATAQGEEFPRFSRFYMERDPNGGDSITVYATLESVSVTGAYRFIITPGAETVMETTCRLFFRQDVAELGIAPLTSMFLFSEKNRAEFDDYRPNVHDSDGLRILRADGDVIWRPLNNPPRLTGSYFAETAPRRFGLHQRDRFFDSYQDTGARYERRPSLDVEPIGDWGRGNVRLVEIPSDLEANDNIVAYWVPEAPARAGDAREFAYRLHWGDLAHDADEPLAYVFETRSGHGGFAGVEAQQGTRKFVVDYKGGLIGPLGGDTEIEAIVTIANGEVTSKVLEKIAGTDIWRLVIDIAAEDDAVVELSAHLAGFDRRLTENWLYQWINAQ